MTPSHAPFEPLDPGRIDVQSTEELHYWNTEFGCTTEQLLHAVERAGNHVCAVREHLHKRKHAVRADATASRKG